MYWQWLLIRFRAKNQNYIKSRLLKSYFTVYIYIYIYITIHMPVTMTWQYDHPSGYLTTLLAIWPPFWLFDHPSQIRGCWMWPFFLTSRGLGREHAAWNPGNWTNWCEFNRFRPWKLPEHMYINISSDIRSNMCWGIHFNMRRSWAEETHNQMHTNMH